MPAGSWVPQYEAQGTTGCILWMSKSRKIHKKSYRLLTRHHSCDKHWTLPLQYYLSCHAIYVRTISGSSTSYLQLSSVFLRHPQTYWLRWCTSKSELQSTGSKLIPKTNYSEHARFRRQKSTTFLQMFPGSPLRPLFGMRLVFYLRQVLWHTLFMWIIDRLVIAHAPLPFAFAIITCKLGTPSHLSVPRSEAISFVAYSTV